MKSLYLAVEDELSEHAGRKIVEYLGGNVVRCFNAGCKSQLQANFQKYRQLAEREAVLLIVDLDRPSHNMPCASVLINEWSSGRALPSKMFVRIAVREIESWLIADHEAMKIFIGTGRKFPDEPDKLDDPKRSLLNLLRQKHLRDDVVRLSKDGNVAQGIAYNNVLGRWVDEYWSPGRAGDKSESLRRAINKLGQYISDVSQRKNHL
ncbi:MAG: DUF4276 family protein [Synergistaceae bacterium]|jgi:hypothetical protein|nr:DUF4276 family protein [Synergistaceae bacterium]